MNRCHYCQRERPDLVQARIDREVWGCPPSDAPECNFRARRRLGVPWVHALELKVRELEESGLPGLEQARRELARLLRAGESSR